jgi:hypothetical protein
MFSCKSTDLVTLVNLKLFRGAHLAPVLNTKASNATPKRYIDPLFAVEITFPSHMAGLSQSLI